MSQVTRNGHWEITDSRPQRIDGAGRPDYFFATLSSLTPNEVVSISGSPV